MKGLPASIPISLNSLRSKNLEQGGEQWEKSEHGGVCSSQLEHVTIARRLS